MLITKLRPFIRVDSLLVPRNGIKEVEGNEAVHKNFCFFIFSENSDFFDAYNAANISKQNIRKMYVPMVRSKIVSFMTPEQRKQIRDYKLMPVKGNVGGDFGSMIGWNFYYDPMNYMNKYLSRFKITNFSMGRGMNFVNNVVGMLGAVPSSFFDKTILYIVNKDEPFNINVRRRKIYPVLNNLIEWNRGKAELSFDRILVFEYDTTGGVFVNIFDKKYPFNKGRLISYIRSLKPNSKEDAIEAHADDVEGAVLSNSRIYQSASSKGEVETIQKTVSNYVKNNPETMPPESPVVSDYIISKAIFSNTIGNKDKVKRISNALVKNFNSPHAMEVLKTHTRKVVARDVVESASTIPFVKLANVSELTDGENPSHLVNLRNKEFNENLYNDIRNIFNRLEDEDLPLKLKSVEVNRLESSPGELEKTIIDRYTIKMTDDSGKEQSLYIDLPHLNEDNTFLVNGKKKILVTQIITYPIFFFKPYSGSFESSYSTMSIHSKKLKNRAYLLMFLGGYKLPMIMPLALQIGFENALRLFKIEYTILENKTATSIKLPDGRYIEFLSSGDVEDEIIGSFEQCVKYFPSGNYDIMDNSTWREIVSNYTGTRNSIHIIDQVWRNIVTPITKDVLETRGDPSDLEGIIRYISGKVVHGYVDDRNDIGKARVRLSEMFTALLQKQVNSAYTEYLSKKRGGDNSATLYVNPTKTFSEVITSQNVQEFESINATEELSMLTRITPVGIGGVTNVRSFPDRARNIHHSYYGNIDPLESPEGQSIGIQQHLSIGAFLNNNRGLFGDRDIKDINPSAILSTTPSMIPFVNNNEGARITMASGQAKQAFPLKEPEVPMVQSGYESILTPLLSSNFVKKSPINGTVVSIEDNIITIKPDTGDELQKIDISPVPLRSGQGKNGLSIFHETVKVGERVKKNQIVAEGANIKNGTISNGLNMLCAFMPWKGYNFEDGMVISESAAKRFVSLHHEEYKVYLTEEDDVVNIVNEGDVLKRGDILITYSNDAYDIETYETKRCDGGKVVSIEVYNNLEDDAVPEKLKPHYKRYVKKYRELNGKYPKGTFREAREKIEGIMIKFVIVQELTLTRGDKLNNRFFNKGVCCFSDDTEIFTNKGWKLIKDLKEDEMVASMSDNGKTEFVIPEAYHSYDYEGEMIGYKGQRVDFLVTPNHRIYYKKRWEENYKIDFAENVFGNRNIEFKCDTNFDLTRSGEYKEKFILEDFHSDMSKSKREPELTFDRKDFMQFFGWWITEGCIYKQINKNNKQNKEYPCYKVVVTQSDSKPEYVEEISELFDRMGFNWKRYGSNFQFFNVSLFKYLEQFGKCCDKYIPEEFFEDSRENLQILFDTMIKGDGCIRSDSCVQFFSTSKRLIDDVVRLATLLGYFCNTIHEDYKNRKNVKYSVYIHLERKYVTAHKIENWYKANYSGKVYCVTVSGGVVYVRRNGKPVWSGNSIIESDSNMPVLPDGRRIDMCYNPLSLINRMNPGQLFELHSGMISKQLAEFIKTKDRKSFQSIFFKVLETLDSTDEKKYSRNLISGVRALSDAAYEKLKKETEETGFIPLVFPPFKGSKKDQILDALKIVGLQPRYKLFLPEYNTKTDPVAVGYIYVLKLEHISEKKIHSRGIGPYVSKTLAPTAGKKSGGGAYVGEYDLYSLLSYNANTVVDELFGPLSADHVTKNEMISEIVQNGETNFKEPKTNPVRDMFMQYMTAIHIEGD